jgi:pimeloyl-ACP methyl ester carboxylesterase
MRPMTSMTRLRFGWLAAVTVLAASALWVVSGVAQAASPAPSCQAIYVPVTIPAVSDAALYGELCIPGGHRPTAVQLLVHGGTYTHAYWDMSPNADRYSYVQKALAAGYATFNVDRLGAGASSHPASSQVTLENGAEALHQVITQLRAGALGGHAFSRVIWVGHSFGSLLAWLEASRYNDVYAFVLTGLLHSSKPSWATMAFADIIPASLDPVLAGYLTTAPGTRADLFYYLPNADPGVIALDEGLKSTETLAEIQTASTLLSSPLPPPDTSPSRAIAVPTLLVLGDHDNIACRPPDGLDCTAANVMAQEAPYYSRQAHLHVQIVPRTGHDIQLHLSAATADKQILDWLGGQM